MAGLINRRRIAKILSGIVGALVGAAFSLFAAMAALSVLSDGNTLGVAFALLALAPIVLHLGAVAGGIAAVRVTASLLAESTSDVERQQKRRTLYRVFIGVPAAFAAVHWTMRESLEPASDASMLKHFDRHARLFDALVAMSRQDERLVRVDENWTSPDDPRSIGVSDERLATYRRLLREAGTPRGFQLSTDPAGIDFLFWLQGSAISDDHTKGFAYRPEPPTGVVATLDGVRGAPRERWTAYRHIRENWYLFYEFIPG
jgi:hypothetical protein